MGVTDLNASLPWWATQGGPAGSGGLPGGAAMPGGQGWLQYLAQMYGLGNGQDPNAPSPDAQPVSMTDLTDAANGGGFAVPPADPNVNPHGDAPPGPVSPTVTPPRPPPSPLGASVGINRPPPVGAGLLDQSGVVRMGGPQGVLNTQRPTGASAPVGAGLLDQSGVARSPAGVLTPGAVNPNAPSPAATPVSSPAAPGGATAAPRAAPQGGAPAANPRFTTFQYNVPGSGGGQGGRNAPIYTALNLGGLFGGQPQGAPAQTPRVPGPLANRSPTTGQPMPMSSMDVAYGLPDARGAPYPYALGGPSDIRKMGDTPETLAATRKAAAIAAAAKRSGYA